MTYIDGFIIGLILPFFGLLATYCIRAIYNTMYQNMRDGLMTEWDHAVYSEETQMEIEKMRVAIEAFSLKGKK